MSEMHESQLHAWLQYRDEMSRRVTVADRVVRNVEALTLERPVRGIGRGRLLLVAAAVAAMLFAAIAVPHALLRSQSGGEYAPAASPRGVPNTPPPTGTSLLWVIDPADSSRLVALDHNLRPVGWLNERGDPFGAAVKQSGDGQRLLLPDWQHGGTMEVTAQGQQIPLPRTSRKTGPNTSEGWNAAFSDDDRSVCIEQGKEGTPRTLVVADPAGRAVHTIAEPPAGNPSYLSWHVVTCSVRNDLAVLIGEPDPQPVPVSPPPSGPGNLGMAEGFHTVRAPAGEPNYIVREVRLSTGAEFARRVYETSRPQPIDASTDGTLVLERNVGSNSYTVRNVVTGAVASTLDADVRNMLDDRLLIEQRTSLYTGWVGHVVVDIRTARPLWNGDRQVGATIEYIGDGAGVFVVTRHGPSDRCPAFADVEFIDLVTGSTAGSSLDTCQPR